MVTKLPRHAELRSAALVVLLACAGCGSFDRVGERRYALLDGDSQTYDRFQISGAHWLAYDDQHSTSFACTNGAAGNHPPDECSLLLKQPPFSWVGPKCHLDPKQLEEAKLDEPGQDGLWVQGIRRKLQPCVTPHPTQCYELGGDVSNMWGAGVGLIFSSDGTTPWNAALNHVRGIAFDFVGSAETRANLRVGIPTLLEEDTPLPPGRPLMRTNGSVLGTDGKVYDCESRVIAELAAPERLSDAHVDGESGPLSSGQHPYGPSFWQLRAVDDFRWRASPVVEGHNEFEWSKVMPPPEPGINYAFDPAQILGVQFQIVSQTATDEDLLFAFRIQNLALLLE